MPVPVPSHSRFAIFVRVLLLPGALVLGTVAGLGSYYETSDDASLAWLFGGVLALKPVPSLPLYFHGYGHGLAAAYAAFPHVPWFGLLNAALLGVATVLVFAVLDRLLRPRLRPVPLGLALAVFFLVGWLEHWLWFSHVRGSVLLAGAAVLFAAQRPGRRGALLLGLAGLGAAWLIRPSASVLGAAAALPAAVLLAGSVRRALPVVGSAALVLGVATGLGLLLQTPGAARTQSRDRAFASVLDFEQRRAAPRTPADSLGTAALSLWLMGDSSLVNEALVQRAYRFDAPDFLTRQLPARLGARAALLVRDYFPLLLALAASALAVRRFREPRAGFWLVQLGCGGGLVFLAGWLKLPPRLALPVLDFWLLANLAFLVWPDGFRPAAAGRSRPVAFVKIPRSIRWAGGAAGLVVLLLYGAKTGHRRQVLRAERHRHERALEALAQARAGRLLIAAGTNDLLKSLSPFRCVSLGPGPVLMLSGWPSHDASQARLRLALSGTADQTECLRRLATRAPAAARPAPLWVLTPGAAAWLQRRFRHAGRAPLPVLTSGRPFRADSTLRFYRAQPAAAR